MAGTQGGERVLSGPDAPCYFVLASALDFGKVPGPGLTAEVLGWALGPLPRRISAPGSWSYAKRAEKDASV